MRFIRFIWRTLNNLRRLLQLLIMFFIFAIIVAGLSGQGVQVPEKAALVVAPSGPLVEQLEGDALGRALAEAQGVQVEQTLLRDVVDSLHAAAEDDRIQAVVLALDRMGGGGLAKLQTVAAAVERVRNSGKLVIAVGDSYSQDQYYVAAHADEIYMHDLGSLFVDGYGYYRTYLKDALDKLKIDMNVFKVGRYKSFVEPFTRDDMSADDKEASGRWLGALWSAYQRDVEAARGLEAGSLEGYANDFLAKLAATEGDLARVALDAGLVDHLGSRFAYRDRMLELVGPSESDDESFSQIDFQTYLQAVRSEQRAAIKSARVGVLVASGEIVDGDAPRGTIGGDTLAGLISRAASDDSIKALVLRIDSPGGSMFASEVVFGELQRLKLNGKPLVVSMSSTAASGGYYIAMTADEIWASESTITGSIGVGALVPTFQRTLDSLGVHVDGFGTTKLAGQFRIDREFGEDARALLQMSVDEAYRVFIGKVAAERNLSTGRVDNLAQGRVWIGSDALELGLVDQLGGLDDAVASAAERAGLSEGEYSIEYVEADLTLRERIALELTLRVSGFARAFGVGTRGKDQPDLLKQVVAAIENELGWLAMLNDPRGLYYHCFCQLP